ncbi:structural protein P5 [Vibrio pectenicida]|uniref:structural protein P5 n=1 Tax=Vibrio pectenicida TaxID=62763 RepID=UPI003B9CE2DE
MLANGDNITTRREARDFLLNRSNNFKGFYIEIKILLSISLFFNFLIFILISFYFINDSEVYFKSSGLFVSVDNYDNANGIGSRGIRNNNPLNIRNSNKNKWLGEVKKKRDSEFEEFVSVEFGFRAGYKTLMTYRKKYDIKTIEGIVKRFSPPNENNTESIINKISIMTGIPRNESIGKDEYIILIQKMAVIESGHLFNIELIKKGISIN